MVSNLKIMRVPVEFKQVIKVQAAARNMTMTKFMKQIAEKNKRVGLIELKF